jgi:hypothetical protein
MKNLFKRFKDDREKQVENLLKQMVLDGDVKYTIDDDGEYRWYHPKRAPKSALGTKDMAKQIKSELK